MKPWTQLSSQISILIRGNYLRTIHMLHGQEKSTLCLLVDLISIDSNLVMIENLFSSVC